MCQLGYGAHFKDWQIAKAGSDGPRKLQAYKSPAPEITRRWQREDAEQFRAFLGGRAAAAAGAR